MGYFGIILGQLAFQVKSSTSKALQIDMDKDFGLHITIPAPLNVTGSSPPYIVSKSNKGR